MKSNIVILRVIATISVVLFHTLGYYTYAWPFDGTKVYEYHLFDTFINQINMPLFVAMSGYLFQIKSKESNYLKPLPFIKNKFYRLIIPYLFWGGLQLIIFSKTTNYQMIFSGILHLWFLLMMFEILIIMRLLYKWTCNYHLLIVLFTITLITSDIPIESDILCINAVVHYLPFFLLGIIISKNDNSVKPSLPFTFIFIISSLILATCTYKYGNPPIYINYVRTVSICIILFCLFVLVIAIPNLKNVAQFPIVQSINNNSLGIYIIHHILIWGVIQIPIIRMFLDSDIFLPPLVLFLFAFCASWSISMLLNRTHYLRIILGERIK